MAIVDSVGTDFLLEREELLASLRVARADAEAGNGHLVLVGGEAGVGKTALVRRFSDEAGGAAPVLWGGCDPLATPPPLGPFLEIAGHAPGAVSDVIDAGAGAHAVATALLGLGDRRAPAVVVLEDVHWADEATLDALRVIGRRVAITATLVIATYRDDELERDHPLRICLGDLATAAGVDRLHVEPLTRDGVMQLAAGRDVDPVALYALTSGNPFYVTEVLATGSEEIPESVRDIVLARVAQLSPRATAVVEAAAIAPPSLDAALLLAVCGEAADSVDECLGAGVLQAIDGGVAFRHELARATVEGSVSPARRLALHRAVLLALADAQGSPDLARVAYHAEAAGDREAVLRFAPAAAAHAVRIGAYREAAAQYARALRYADGLDASERADLLEGRSRACYLADDQVAAIAVIEEAVDCRRRAGEGPKQARALTELSRYLGCRGLVTEAVQAVQEATRLVAEERAGRELACVYAARAWLSGGARGHEEIETCLELADTAIRLAERHDDHETALDALVTRGTAELRRDVAAGRATLERAAALGRQRGIVEQVARALNNIGGFGAQQHDHEVANSYLAAALEYCTDHDLDLWRINVLALMARSQLDQARWSDAAQSATLLLQDPRDSPWPHHEALLVLALVRGRRGDPGAREAVEAASAVGVPADEFDAIVDLAAASAEVAWLEGRADDVERATTAMLDAAVERGAEDAVYRLSYWRCLASLPIDPPAGDSASPYALSLAGDWDAAAALWARLGCPYEQALALAGANEEDALRQSLDMLQRLGARPAAKIVARRLRERGARDVPSGPRASTRRNPARVTARELDVLRLLAEGLRNGDIAERLFLSRRTVDHHVSAILRKLGASTRGEAVAAATRLGLLQDR
jgi:DNA-binding CsgD family transcriptional regulator/tetratricopeptide (TPR) repeat protein